MARPNTVYCKYRRDTTPCAVIGCNMYWEALIPSGARCRQTEEGWGSLTTAPAEVNDHRFKDVRITYRESMEPNLVHIRLVLKGNVAMTSPHTGPQDNHYYSGGVKFPGCHLAHGQMT